MLFFVKFPFCHIITGIEFGLQILVNKIPLLNCSPIRPVMSSYVVQTDVTKLVVAFRSCF